MRVTGEEDYDKAMKALQAAKGVALRVGYFADATYPSGVHVATIAAINEYGFPPHNIPARPFMRPAIAKNGEDWKKKLSSGMRAVLQGNNTIDEVLETIGGLAAADCAVEITKLQAPPLKKATVKARVRKLAKGSRLESTIAKPLVETGILLKVQWQVTGHPTRRLAK
jgi:hypothetical protein